MMEIRKFEPQHAAVKVGVLLGGTSSEREVSLVSGRGVAEALRQSGFNVTEIDVTEDAIPEAARACDVLFLALHGGFGEDGGMQQLLDDAGIVYVGSDAASSRLCMDKCVSKEALEKAGLPTPQGMIVKERGTTLEFGLTLPLVVKPNSGGSSVALAIVNTPIEWLDAMDAAFDEEGEILVEEFVTGKELTVGVIDGQALTPVEIVPPNGVYDYDAKYVYNQGKTEYFCPPRDLDENTIDRLKRVAEQAWHALGNRDLVRVDMIIDAKGVAKILEANTLPGFTPTSLLPKAAQHDGISYAALCTHLILTALARKGN